MASVELVIGGWFASAAISKLIEKLDKYISDQHDRRRDVRAKLEELKSFLTVLNGIKGDADGAEIEDRRSQLRLVQLREAVYDAEDLLYPVLSSNSPTETSVKRLDINDLKNVSDSFKKIVDNIGDFSNLPKHPPVVSEYRQTNCFPTGPLLGRDEEKARLLNLLRTDDGKSKSNFKIIAIVGMGGSGKTALAQHVFNDESIKKRFENLTVWVCVTHSHSFDFMTIIKEVLRKLKPIRRLNVTHSIRSLNRNQEIVNKRLKGKRFLIVLDDVWNLTPEQWRKLCAPFEYAMKGSRFILTTRNPDLVRRLPVNQTVSLGEIQWRPYLDLFQRRAFGDDANPTQYPKWVSIGTEIANKLKGSPLAAETVGAELRSNLDAEHWRSVRDSRLCDIKQDGDGIIPSLRLTYLHLPAHLKQCFAFGALFPPNYVFESPQSLVSMWIAQGFVQSSGSKNVKDTGMDYFKELLDISFFQRADQENKNRYVINTLLHEVAWSIANTEYCVIDNKMPVQIPEKLRHLCVVGNTLPEVCKDEYKMKRLRSLVLLGDFYFYRKNRKMFSKLKSLRLLIISVCKRKLPRTIIDNLKHVPYLYITTETISFSGKTKAFSIISEIGFSGYHTSNADTESHSCPTPINLRPQQRDQPGTSNRIRKRDRMRGFLSKFQPFSD